MQKQSGIAINSKSLRKPFQDRNKIAVLELLVPAGNQNTADLQRRRRIVFFDTAARLLDAPPGDTPVALETVLPYGPLLTGGWEPIFTLALFNQDKYAIFVEEAAAEILGVAARTAPTMREPIPKTGIMDIRITARTGVYRHPLQTPLQISPRSKDSLSIRLISTENSEHRYELKLVVKADGIEVSTDAFLLRM